MRRVLILLFSFFILSGCSQTDDAMSRALKLRQRLLNSQEYHFQATVDADYGDSVYQFSVACKGTVQGDLEFTVLKPESIAGITGKLSKDGAGFTFDDKVLAFPMLANDQLTPVSAPWVFMKSLLSGYIHGAGMEGERLCVQVDDSYADSALQLQIWLNDQNLPVQAEIIYAGMRIVSIQIQEFVIL